MTGQGNAEAGWWLGLAVLAGVAFTGVFLEWAPHAEKSEEAPKKTEQAAKNELKPVSVVVEESEKPNSQRPKAQADKRAEATQAKAALGEGDTPSLRGQFGIPFKDYWSAMADRGAALAVYDQNDEKIVARIKDGAVEPFNGRAMKGYAKRARDVTEDIPESTLMRHLERLESAQGASDYRFVVLLPEAEETQFVGVLKTLVEQAGIGFNTLDRVDYRYGQTANGSLKVTVSNVHRKGERIPIKESGQLP